MFLIPYPYQGGEIVFQEGKSFFNGQKSHPHPGIFSFFGRKKYLFGRKIFFFRRNFNYIQRNSHNQEGETFFQEGDWILLHDKRQIDLDLHERHQSTQD